MSDMKRFVDLYQEAAQNAEVTPPTTFEIDDAPRRHALHQRRIVRLTICAGVLGVLLGIVLALVQCGQGGSRCIAGLIRVPPMFGAMGVFFALSMGCLFVPSDFLRGPLGESWMRLIGVKSVLGARIVCLLFVLVIMLPLIGLLVLIMLNPS